MVPTEFSPLRSIADVEALERIPLGERISSWDANDWIRSGLDRAPDKIAIQYVADGRPDTPPVAWTYRELKARTIATANLFRSLGVGETDAVLYLMPTIPSLYTVMLASLAAGVSCCVNWMLEPSHWVGLIAASRAKVVVVLGPTPGYEIFEKFQTIRAELPAGVRVLTVQMPGDRQLPDTDVELLASRQPGGQLAFRRKAGPDDIAA
jgi:fatty-acyl-CoA synthase